MLVSVEGCSSPSTLELISITRINSSSASVHRPASFLASATIAILVSVSLLSCPSSFSLSFMDCVDIFSASDIVPLAHAYDAALYKTEATAVKRAHLLASAQAPPSHAERELGTLPSF